MFKYILSFMFVLLLFNLVPANPVYAESEKDVRLTEKIKKGVLKLGTGESARVEVKLLDNTKLKGYIKEAGESSFTIVDPANGAETKIDYPQTKQIKGNNLSTGAKVAIGLGILAAVLAIWLIFENYG